MLLSLSNQYGANITGEKSRTIKMFERIVFDIFETAFTFEEEIIEALNSAYTQAKNLINIYALNNNELFINFNDN
jgi:hypothetical protein